MTTASDHRPMALAALALLAAYGTESRRLPFELQAHSFAYAAWSEPVNLGPAINTGVVEGNPVLSRDGLSLYFDSDRTDLPGAMGARDIYVSRRACRDCPWETPVNLGPEINTLYVDAAPELSDDGHLLFFTSHKTRPNCEVDPTNPPRDPTRPCDNDLYVARRVNTHDDLGWGPPVSLGPDVNTPFQDNEPDYLESAEEGRASLYFSRTPQGEGLDYDIYYAAIRIGRGGAGEPIVESFGPAVRVSELSLANLLDTGVTVRADGRELYFFSAAPRGGLGRLDIWVSTRRSVHEPWSAPTNATPLNSVDADLSPSLSHDGRTLVFVSDRQGPRGNWDIYMSTRTPSGH